MSEFDRAFFTPFQGMKAVVCMHDATSIMAVNPPRSLRSHGNQLATVRRPRMHNLKLLSMLSTIAKRHRTEIFVKTL